MTPTNDRVSKKTASNWRKSIPLFNSPKIRKSMGLNESPAGLLNSSLGSESPSANLDFNAKTTTLVSLFVSTKFYEISKKYIELFVSVLEQ